MPRNLRKLQSLYVRESHVLLHLPVKVVASNVQSSNSSRSCQDDLGWIIYSSTGYVFLSLP